MTLAEPLHTCSHPCSCCPRHQAATQELLSQQAEVGRLKEQLAAELQRVSAAQEALERERAAVASRGAGLEADREAFERWRQEAKDQLAVHAQVRKGSGERHWLQAGVHGVFTLGRGGC